MKRKRQRGLRLNPAWCYLCGLPIPRDIVSPTHPLFGTVDHTIPAPEEVRMRCTTEHPFICYAIKRRATESYMTPNGTLKN